MQRWPVFFLAAGTLSAAGPVRIEIMRVENYYLSESGISESRITWKTGEAVLFQVRRGYNCRNGDPLDAVNYSGVTEAEKENVLRIRAGALRPGANTLVLCVNRAPLGAASSDQLDYGSDVYEKNVTLTLDPTPPVTAAQKPGEDSDRPVELVCSDDTGCEGIQYKLEGQGRSESFSEKGRLASVSLAAYPWAESLSFSSTDKAGNKEREQRIELPARRDVWFGHGRISFYPFWGFTSSLTVFGAGVASEFPLARLFHLRQASWLPAFRLQAALGTGTSGENNETSYGMVAAGFSWLFPLQRGEWGSLTAGIAGGPARYFSIINGRQVTSTSGGNVSIYGGYEFRIRKFFIFGHWRLTCLIGDSSDCMHGPAAGAGVIF